MGAADRADRADRVLDVGVIGVGSMGGHHARVYRSLPNANLVGVCDADADRAATVASDYETAAIGLDSLLSAVDAVSVAVPTPVHYDMVTRCLDAGVAVLVEKPVVGDLNAGDALLERTARADVPVQVGHVERFNPVIRTLTELLDEFSIIGLTADRLGPPPAAAIDDSAVLDLMIHDIDVVCTLLGERPIAIKGSGVRENAYTTALLEFEDDLMASLTASHRTQKKVRTLKVTAEEGLIVADYIDQTIEIHRRSVPEYVTDNGNVRYRHESTVEHVQVPNEEPLRNELDSFVEAVMTDAQPTVAVEDGLAALKIAREIERAGLAPPSSEEGE